MRRQAQTPAPTNPINVGAGPGIPLAAGYRRGATGHGRALGQQSVGGGTSYNLLAGLEPRYAPPVRQSVQPRGERHDLAGGDGSVGAGVGVGSGLGRNDGDLTAVGAAPAVLLNSLLTLPRLSADVPTQIDLSNGQHERATALIAQALIDGKMLLDDEQSYVGNLADSVTLGLRERLAAYGAEDLGFFGSWRLIWTDDVREMDLLPKATYSTRILGESMFPINATTMPLGLHTASERVVGGFAIGSFSSAGGQLNDEATIGLGVEWLISHLGRATGWRIWRVFQTALDVAGLAITPALLRQFAISCWGEDYDDPDWERNKMASDFDITTPGWMDFSIPWQAMEFMRESDPRLLRRAVGDYRRRCAARPPSCDLVPAGEARADLAMRCLGIAAYLGTTIERRFRGIPVEQRERYYLNHLHAMLPDTSISSRAVRWSDYDCVGRMCDDYVHSHDDLAGVSCLISFVTDAEEPEQPGGLDWAARSLRDLIAIVVGCDEMVGILDASDEDHSTRDGVWPKGTKPGKHPPRPPKEHKSNLLIDILGGEADYALDNDQGNKI